jgi:hypothetical protein
MFVDCDEMPLDGATKLKLVEYLRGFRTLNLFSESLSKGLKDMKNEVKRRDGFYAQVVVVFFFFFSVKRVTIVRQLTGEEPLGNLSPWEVFHLRGFLNFGVAVQKRRV